MVTKDDLVKLLEVEAKPKHYIGLEISGLLHLASLILVGNKINDMLRAGVKCTVFLADWHSYINNKFGGEWEKIRIASQYYAEAFKLFCPGVDIKLGSDLYRETEGFWEDYVRFCKNITLARNTRCLTIMGRSEKNKLDFSQYLYPPLQAVDIHTLGVDIAHAGMDQRKVHMMAREVFPALGWKPPVAVHHHLLPGLGEPQRLGLDEEESSDVAISSKMSKSKPWTCIFIHDSDEVVEQKIRRAWCPPKTTVGNPVLEIAGNIIFRDGGRLNVERPQRFGGQAVFEDYASLEKAYAGGEVHPADLKPAISRELSVIISPIREHFSKRRELLEVFESEGK